MNALIFTDQNNYQIISLIGCLLHNGLQPIVIDNSNIISAHISNIQQLLFRSVAVSDLIIEKNPSVIFVKGDIDCCEAIILAAKISKIACFLLIENSIKYSPRFLDADFIPEVIGTETSRLNYQNITNGMEALRRRPRLSSLANTRQGECNVSFSSNSLPNVNWFDSADFFSITLMDGMPEYNLINIIDILETSPTEKIIEDAKLISAYFRKEKSSSWMDFTIICKSFFNTR